MKTSIVLFFTAIAILLLSKSTFSAENMDSAYTKWKIESSLKYDACCFLNILTGDEFYLTYYRQEYENFKDKLPENVKQALTGLKKKVKDDGGAIISAWLCLYFSAVEGGSIDDILKTLNDLTQLKANFTATPYYNDESWALFESVTSELKAIFSYLKEIDFEGYWTKNVLPRVEAKITEIKPGLSDYDVIKENE